MTKKQPKKHNPTNREILLDLLERMARVETTVDMLKWIFVIGLSAFGLLVTFISLFIG